MSGAAILTVRGCCGTWRGQLIINLGDRRLVTLDAFGPSERQARAAVLALADQITIAGCEPWTIRERAGRP